MRRDRNGFTLTEMLVTIAIIGIMAGLMLGGVQVARNSARESATKATIAKLNNIIMARYESYLTRRIPLGKLVYGKDFDAQRKKDQPLSPADAAKDRLYALRDLMRMEMPDRGEDVADNPIALPWSQLSLQRPALSQRYYNRISDIDFSSSTGVGNDAAELLFMIVSMGSPEAMEQFGPSEIGDTNKNGLPEFLDGWGRPIFWLRWAPGFSSCRDPDFVAATGIHYTGASQVQSGVAQPYPRFNSDGTPMMNPNGTRAMASADHDPFDTRNVESSAFHLIPLIYSNGSNAGDASHGIDLVQGYSFAGTTPPGDMFLNADFLKIGSLLGITSFGGITNHYIEQR